MIYQYCGECHECFPFLSENFPGCKRSGCKQFYSHPQGHGFYCVSCGIRKKMFVEHNDMYFCNKRCFGVYEKEQALSLVEECSATPVKCPYCNENKPCCKFRIVAGKGIFCDDGKI